MLFEIKIGMFDLCYKSNQNDKYLKHSYFGSFQYSTVTLIYHTVVKFGRENVWQIYSFQVFGRKKFGK